MGSVSLFSGWSTQPGEIYLVCEVGFMKAKSEKFPFVFNLKQF